MNRICPDLSFTGFRIPVCLVIENGTRLVDKNLGRVYTAVSVSYQETDAIITIRHSVVEKRRFPGAGARKLQRWRKRYDFHERNAFRIDSFPEIRIVTVSSFSVGIKQSQGWRHIAGAKIHSGNTKC